MVFSSLSMLLFFLPGVLLMYALIWYVYGKRSTTVPNLFLCLASLCFYSWGARNGTDIGALGADRRKLFRIVPATDEGQRGCAGRRNFAGRICPVSL